MQTRFLKVGRLPNADGRNRTALVGREALQATLLMSQAMVATHPPATRYAISVMVQLLSR